VSIDYEHVQNTHTLMGPEEAFPVVLRHLINPIQSVADVGCGTGSWLRAALLRGIVDVQGFDGVLAPESQLAVDRGLIRTVDLTQPISCDRRFDVAICLEVAEHLEETYAGQLVRTLVGLSDQVLFSAACPGQPGQHHVNCQWPAYWQFLFNSHGFVCKDAVRWAIWNMAAVEPWYRQNTFLATRDPARAGKEPRIPAVMHPEMAMMRSMLREHHEQQLRDIEAGSLPMWWYFITPFRAMASKIGRQRSWSFAKTP